MIGVEAGVEVGMGVGGDIEIFSSQVEGALTTNALAHLEARDIEW